MKDHCVLSIMLKLPHLRNFRRDKTETKYVKNLQLATKMYSFKGRGWFLTKVWKSKTFH